jgi:hypothetical protein
MDESSVRDASPTSLNNAEVQDYTLPGRAAEKVWADADRAKIQAMFPRSPARFSLLALLFATLASVLHSQAPRPDSKSSAPDAQPAAAPVLIELFTSEGCSSCPPADTVLQRLDDLQPIQGAQLIVLSEHVTYWDHDGWKDPNSSQAFTDRQSSYEGALGIKGPYTPQFIIDGTQVGAIDKLPEFESELKKAKDTAKIPIRIAGVTFDPANPTVLRTHIEADANPDKHNADVYLALALNHVESQVLHGENGGKHLVHVAVVQQLTKVGRLSNGKPFAKDVELKLKPGEDLKNLRLVAFVQESGPGKMLGASMRNPVN